MKLQTALRFVLIVFAVSFAAPIRLANALADLRARSARLWSALGCAARLLPLLLLLTLPAAVQAQFNYTINNGTITIKKYDGPGGAVTIPSTITGLSVTSIGENAFYEQTSLTSVTSIGSPWASSSFSGCTSLTSVYFQGNAPYDYEDVFVDSNVATVHYLAGTTGWGATYAGRPTAIWSFPLILSSGPDFGVTADGFGFLISWAPDSSVVVEAGADLAHPVWFPVSTNTPSSGTFHFSDPLWTDYPIRFYRVVSSPP